MTDDLGTLMERAGREITAQGYDRAATNSGERADSLNVASIILKHVEIGEAVGARIVDELQSEGLLKAGESLEQVKGRAEAAVRAKADFETAVSRSAAETRDGLLASLPQRLEP